MSLWTRSGHVAQLDRVREGPQLLQALVLDLPVALAGDVERPPDLVERSRMLAVEAVAELEHLAWIFRSVSLRIVVSASSSGSGRLTSVRKCPNSDSSSSPTGFSSDTGV